MKILLSTLALVAILFTGCTSLIENGLEDNFIGCWHSTSYFDENSGQEIELPLSGFNTFLNHSGDSFDVDADGEFVMYNQDDVFTETASGTWTFAFGTATFAFSSGDTIVRSITGLDGQFISVPDTINGNPIIVNFAETCE